MERDYEALIHSAVRIMHKHSQRESGKRNYGLDIPLSGTEIHVIDEIGKNEGIGVRALAKSKGVTEGAVSQLMKKLVAKGLVQKETSKESEAKVCLSLTKDGWICYNNHKEYHEQANRRWYELFDEMTDAEYKKVMGMLEKVEELM